MMEVLPFSWFSRAVFFMKNITIFEVIVILLTLRESFLLGLVVIAYILAKHNEQRHMKLGFIEALKRLQGSLDKENKKVNRKLKAVLDEINESDIPDFKEPAQMPVRFVQYGNFIIEDYGGWYLVKKPDMTAYEKMFNNIEDAKKVIDGLAPLYPVQPAKRSRIHNVRWVK